MNDPAVSDPTVAGPAPVTPGVVEEARGWVLDCVWREDQDTLAALPDAAILAGIQRHYLGGIAQFIRDLEPGLTDPALAVESPAAQSPATRPYRP